MTKHVWELLIHLVETSIDWLTNDILFSVPC